MIRTCCLVILLVLTLAQGSRLLGQATQRPLSVGIQPALLSTVIINQQNYGQGEMEYVIPLTLGIGVSIDYAITAKVSLSTGIQYQKQGQAYRGSFKGRDFYREAFLNYWMVPLMVKYFPTGGGDAYTRAARATAPKMYLIGGLQPAFMSSVFAIWEIDENRTDFISFITEGGNPNQEIIEELDPPDSPEDLFTNFDLMIVGGGGVEARIQPGVLLYADIRLGIGLTDLNAEEWRIPSANGKYGASINGFLGLHAGVRFSLF